MTARIETEILIDAPKDAVWAVLTDFAAHTAWNPFVRSLEGSSEVGARRRTAIGRGRKVVTIAPTLVEFEPGRSFARHGALGAHAILNGRHHLRLETEGEDRTRLRPGEVFGGLVSAPLLRVIGKEPEAGFRTMNEPLEPRCEAPPASIASPS